jgi:hypothetical protein
VILSDIEAQLVFPKVKQRAQTPQIQIPPEPHKSCLSNTNDFLPVLVSHVGGYEEQWLEHSSAKAEVTVLNLNRGKKFSYLIKSPGRPSLKMGTTEIWESKDGLPHHLSSSRWSEKYGPNTIFPYALHKHDIS